MAKLELHIDIDTTEADAAMQKVQIAYEEMQKSLVELQSAQMYIKTSHKLRIVNKWWKFWKSK